MQAHGSCFLIWITKWVMGLYKIVLSENGGLEQHPYFYSLALQPCQDSKSGRHSFSYVCMMLWGYTGSQSLTRYTEGNTLRNRPYYLVSNSIIIGVTTWVINSQLGVPYSQCSRWKDLEWNGTWHPWSTLVHTEGNRFHGTLSHFFKVKSAWRE